ncbi:MAG: Wzz/FepE/Etk N-terminal domain-containing protein [Ignavibacteriales bacterium]|nr:Wzz/FepE/Etk N-terminal domain-containing protein [Ignavibacteriales bacterium]
MNDKSQNEQPTSLRTVNVLDYLVVITRHRKFVFGFVAISVLLAAIVLFLVMSKMYKATAVIMPPKQQNSLGLLSSVLRSSTSSSLRSLGLGGPASDELLQYQAILKSRRCMDAVIDRFDLMHVYKSSTKYDAVKELDDNLTLALGKEEVSLEITMYDTDSLRAAQMANYFVEMLNKIHTEMSTAEAQSNRRFLERRYLQNLRDLKDAEDSLKTFQKKTRIYSIPEQLKAGIEAAADLQGQIALREFQLSILSNATTPNNEIRQRLEIETNALRQKMAALQVGDEKKNGQFQIFPPFDKAPELGVQYFRFFRQVELQGKILELILPLYEQAKIEEQRDTPSMLILDNATPPEKASKPRRLLITAIVFVVSIVIGTVLTFFVDYLERAKRGAEEQDREKMRVIRESLNPRNWLK